MSAPEGFTASPHRAIFYDVENSSRAQHVARVLEHLAVDHGTMRTDFVAIGNWRVISDESAHLLARHGARLVHSAPAPGVQDWSDLRIGVAAGVWLGTARAGDRIAIVSADRAFDAIGDVAAILGIHFTRVSYRQLVGTDKVLAAPNSASRRRRRRSPRPQRAR